MLDGTDLRETLQAVLPAALIEEQAHALGVVQRRRKMQVVPLVSSLVLSSGSDDSGRLADARRRYASETDCPVVRGAFYAWMDKELAALMERLFANALKYATRQPVDLRGVLAGVDDWIIVDSETVTLRDGLRDVCPASGSAAGVKVHKDLSVGRGCVSAVRLGPARHHDNRDFVVDGRYAGKGLLVDLGYASLDFVRDCDGHNVRFVIRLKESWKPRVERVHSGELTAELAPGSDLDTALVDEVLLLQGEDIDAEVTIGTGRRKVCARLVAIALPPDDNGEIGYQFYLTNLPRESHTPEDIGALYRVRWEIERDNALDKAVSRLDQIRATTYSSVRILLYAALLHSLLVDLLVHRDLVKRDEVQRRRRPPLHRMLVAQAVRNDHVLLLWALLEPTTPSSRWNKLARGIVEHGHDPNWRSRPSVLDRLRGVTAPPGRRRRRSLSECPPDAAPFRLLEMKPRRAA